MTTYAQFTESISRQPCQIVVITLDTCALEFGVGACTATASSKCYNTFYTCRDRANFDKTTKDFTFSSYDSELPYAGPLPYIESIRLLPTEIGKEITVSGRVKISMLDELSDDVGIDPYYATRSSVQGEFWKKLIARNPNYKGRPVKIYEGYIGLASGDFELRWAGTLDNITVNSNKATIDCVDSLVDLSKFTYPEKIKTDLNTNITASTLAIVLTSLYKEDGTTLIDSAGYVQIEDEIIQYTSITEASNTINVPADGRGAFGTTADEHFAGARVTLVKYFAEKNPFVHMKEIWVDAGGDWATEFDTTEWTKWQAWPREDINFSAIITEAQAITAKDAFWEIANLLDLHVWQNESQLITVRRNIGNDPDRTYADITDSANIISRSGSVDYNEKDRKTRTYHFWNKSVLGAFDELASYAKIDIIALADAEDVDKGFGDIVKDELYNRWVSLRFLPAAIAFPWVQNVTRRRMLHRTFARPLIMVSVELKDEGNQTGDVVTFSTDERLDINGNNLASNHIIIKREKQGGKIMLTLKELPKLRNGIIAPAANPDTYALSSVAEREYGFIAGAKDGLMPNGDEGYYIW